ncbi:hypothetical protein PtrM4_126970 [Pyrenophora tritici-repentis]|uniref:RNA-directed DNA polymerase n=1 Tax=Pyrenophora tritici-repentis TaxID=45151 RepID=A0A834RQV1_9PLEO|nr:hypothetical protein PtrM4_126970 [Pyrenophora tritici-repentis]
MVKGKQLVQGQQFVFKCKVATSNSYIDTEALTDSGATGNCISTLFAQRHNLPTFRLKQPLQLRLGDGNFAMAPITHGVLAPISHAEHVSEELFYSVPMTTYDFIFGTSWLEEHNPHIDWREKTMRFNSEHCYANCLHKGEQVTVRSSRHRRAAAKAKERNPTYANMDIHHVSGEAAAALASRPENGTIWLYPHDFEQLDKDDSDDADERAQASRVFASLFAMDMNALSQEDIDKFHQKLNSPAKTRDEVLDKLPEWLHDLAHRFNPDPATTDLPARRGAVDHSIDIIPGSKHPNAKMYGISKDEGLAVKAYVEDMRGRGEIRESKSDFASPVLVVRKSGGGLRICVDYRALNAVTIKNRNAPPMIKETLARLANVAYFTVVDVIAAFNKIRIKEGDEHKTAFLTRYGLFEYLVMPFGLCNAPGTFQAYINEVLRDYLDEFCSAYLDDVLIYSASLAEHKVHVRKVIESLGEAGLHLDIDKSEFAVQEVRYLGLILTTEGIKMDPAKVKSVLDWGTPTTLKELQAFLGFANFYRRFIVAFSYIARPLTDLTRGTNGDVKLNFPIAQGSAAHDAFEKLKKAFTIAPVLAHFNPALETWVETDSSDTVTAAVLSQVQTDGVLKPVAFISTKMSPAECNYAIYDKELMAIVRAFEEWRPELAGTSDPVKVISDHATLQTFMVNKALNRRQARWAEFLSEFNFKITYRPGRLGSKPDALTRRPGDTPTNPNDPRIIHQTQTILGPDRVDDVIKRDTHTHNDARQAIQLAALLFEYAEEVQTLAGMLYLMSEEAYGVDDLVDDDSTPDIPHAAAPASLARVPGENAPDDGLMTAIVNAYRVDPTLQEIIRAKADGARHLPHTVAIQMKLKLELQDCEIRNSLVYFRGRLFIPYDDDLRKDIVRRFHDTATAGHGGKRSTYYLVSQQYYWPLMTDTVAQYTRSCVVCRRAKPYRDRKQGLLHPLPVPKRFWTDISVDFITPLPDCTRFGRTYSHVMVVIDRLSKSQRFIALDSLEVDAVVRAFVDYVWREEGFPTTIVSDRGSQFVSHFWKELCHRLGVTPKLSTAYHPETDGQTEVANAGLKCYLRAYTNYMQNDWVDWLPLAQLAINNRENVSSGVAPALATKGYLPRMGSELVTEDSPITDARSRAEQLLREDARGTVKRMTDVIRFMQENLRWSQNKMEHYANQHRQPAPDYRVGDKVYIDARNIPTMRPSRGLSAKNLGPYKVRALPNRYAVELALPDCYKQVHPVFHPWLLHLDADQTARPSEGVIAEKHPDGEHDYYVDMVVDCRIDKRRKDTLTNKKGMLQYKVKYTNSPDWNASPAWQDYTDLWGAEEAVEDFHRLYPDKPPPHELYRDLALYLNLVAAYSLGRDDVEVVSVLDSCELALSPSHSLMAQLGPGKVAQLRTSVSKQKQGPEG